MVTQRLRRSGAKAKAGKKVVKRASAAYFDRAQIEDGAIAGRDLEICYLKGPIDAFFAEIQAHRRRGLEDGSVLRLNYAAGNGHPYFAVGSVLIQKGIVSREEMSMQKIRDDMEKNPQEGSELRRMNRSYVFFRETDLTEFDEAIGAQGIVSPPRARSRLTARSTPTACRSSSMRCCRSYREAGHLVPTADDRAGYRLVRSSALRALISISAPVPRPNVPRVGSRMAIRHAGAQRARSG